LTSFFLNPRAKALMRKVGSTSGFAVGYALAYRSRSLPWNLRIGSWLCWAARSNMAWAIAEDAGGRKQRS
jgi:hypothetical protein